MEYEEAKNAAGDSAGKAGEKARALRLDPDVAEDPQDPQKIQIGSKEGRCRRWR
jgi:hypothetical protein